MKKFSKQLPIILVVLGAVLLLYPCSSRLYNSLVQTHAVVSYNEVTDNTKQKEIDEKWNKAVAYNKSLNLVDGVPHRTKEQKLEYYETLDVTGTGIMGYIEIPAIGVKMPIYHGVSDSVLNVAIGHLEWTHLPIGGAGTHAVLAGHRGLPSAKLFTDLPKLKIGDTFVIRILDRVLTYRIDQIVTVDPEDISELRTVRGKDYCTLLTCTPYGINTHRILVRGIRDENSEDVASTTSEDALPGTILVVLVVIILAKICMLLVRRNN